MVTRKWMIMVRVSEAGKCEVGDGDNENSGDTG